MGKKTHSVEESDCTISPANARPELFGSGDKVFEALAILRAVRKPGKDKLGLQEAIAVSLEQGEAFLRYQESATPIRRLQVFVEGTLEMTISLDESSVNLESFHFTVESPRDAVMQILKADEGEPPVVLRNLPLGTVGPKGLIDRTLLPNGQISLQIAPPRDGRFDVKVAFAEGKDVSSLPPIDLVRSKDIAVDVSGCSDKQSSTVSIPRRDFLTIRPSLVLAVLLVCLGLTAFVTLKGQLAITEPITTPEDKVAMQRAKTKPNKKRSFKANGLATSPQTSCCDEQQNTSPEFSGAVADASILIPIQEEDTLPDSLDNQIAGFAPIPERVQPVYIEKPAIKVGEKFETEAKGPASFSIDSNKVAVPLNYSEAGRDGNKDFSRVDHASPYTQKARFESNRPQPD